MKIQILSSPETWGDWAPSQYSFSISSQPTLGEAQQVLPPLDGQPLSRPHLFAQTAQAFLICNCRTQRNPSRRGDFHPMHESPWGHASYLGVTHCWSSPAPTLETCPFEIYILQDIKRVKSKPFLLWCFPQSSPCYKSPDSVPTNSSLFSLRILLLILEKH